jgi:opacity protein-like surface antigen
MARDNSWYVGVGGGVMIVEDIDLDIGTVANAGTLDHRTGYDFEGTVGYDFGGFRAEVEVGYREADITGGRFSTPGIPANSTGGLFTGNTPLNGDSNALSFMANGMLDFGDDDGLQGFVGGGAGVARVSIQPVFATNFLDDSDTRFAWQAIAGVRAPLTKHWDAGLKYRFFNVSDLKMVDQLGRDVSGRTVYRVLRLGSVGDHAGSGCNAGQRDQRLQPWLQRPAGHARRSRRPFGFGQVQRRSVAASRRCREVVHDGSWRCRWFDHDAGVRRNPPGRCNSRWRPQRPEPSRGNHLRSELGHVRPVFIPDGEWTKKKGGTARCRPFFMYAFR